jgi:hypothetical protein
MGEGADMLTDFIERGQTIIRDRRTGKELIVDNLELMYGNIYEQERYEIIGDVDAEGELYE